jgi:hypothetical protein
MFIDAMERGLAHGRDQGRTGWDTRWKFWQSEPATLNDIQLMLEQKLDEELDEFRTALEDNIPSLYILHEAADVANILMMLADVATLKQARGV